MNSVRRIHDEIEGEFAHGGVGKGLFVFQCTYGKKHVNGPPQHQLRVGVMSTVVTVSHAPCGHADATKMPCMTFEIFNLEYPSRPPSLISVGSGPSSSSCSYDCFLRGSVVFMKSMRLRFKKAAKEEEEEGGGGGEDEESKCFAEFYRRGCPCCSSMTMSCRWRPAFSLTDIFQEFMQIYAAKRRYLAIYWLRKAANVPRNVESLVLSFLGRY